MYGYDDNAIDGTKPNYKKIFKKASKKIQSTWRI